jgi:hypothetical protein
LLFGLCPLLLIAHPVTKKLTIPMADKLAERRRQAAKPVAAAQ